MYQALSHLGLAFASGAIKRGTSLCIKPIPLGTSLCIRYHPTWDSPMHQAPSYVELAYTLGPIPVGTHHHTRLHPIWILPIQLASSHSKFAASSSLPYTSSTIPHINDGVLVLEGLHY
ncbi:hypothetical protein Adt_31739 [Abeliophyllum distichum]|uniref:Uncharacterized protein n=1 Tax=Abeliophyllum distichum TaxID=126358 RepID=A0ABD1RGR5_9LAMI